MNYDINKKLFMHGPLDIGTILMQKTNDRISYQNLHKLVWSLQRSFSFHVILLMEIEQVLND